MHHMVHFQYIKPDYILYHWLLQSDLIILEGAIPTHKPTHKLLDWFSFGFVNFCNTIHVFNFVVAFVLLTFVMQFMLLDFGLVNFCYTIHVTRLCCNLVLLTFVMQFMLLNFVVTLVLLLLQYIFLWVIGFNSFC